MEIKYKLKSSSSAILAIFQMHLSLAFVLATGSRWLVQKHSTLGTLATFRVLGFKRAVSITGDSAENFPPLWQALLCSTHCCFFLLLCQSVLAIPAVSVTYGLAPAFSSHNFYHIVPHPQTVCTFTVPPFSSCSVLRTCTHSSGELDLQLPGFSCPGH